MKFQVGEILKSKLNNYTIKEQIDEGGNGTVWKVQIIGDSIEYAVKVLKGDKDKDKEKLSRFESECQFCIRAQHKHIVKVLDFIVEKGNAYCVMPYYPRNLRTIINTENDSFVLLNYIIQLCEAIQFIHNNGVIHRDLKPENILVGNDNTLVLTDFGIAHFENSTRTNQRDWLGNRRYAAPEQLATDEVSTACDVYALGRIINELFTKQNPSGEAFLTIADKNPLLLPLDNIVRKCRIQTPELRPCVSEILMELYLLEGEIKDRLVDIKETIYPIEETSCSEKEEDSILFQASQDILLAQYIFESLPEEKMDELNVNYHCNILYDIDESIQNLLLQTHILRICKSKFRYEASAYIRGQSYESLNLDDEKDKRLYDELNEILDNHNIPYDHRDITARIKKIFCSCCHYHCLELLGDIKELCERQVSLIEAPILYIVYILRKNLDKEDLREINLSKNITINWKMASTVKIEQPGVYLEFVDQEEIKILNAFKEQYDTVYEKADFKHYYIRFKTIDSFVDFKNYALELSHPHYVFEGDVEKVIRIRRRYHDVVELEPLDSFDITNTLAKILGFRSDY